MDRIMWLGDINSPKFFVKENAEYILDNAKRVPFSVDEAIELLTEAAHDEVSLHDYYLPTGFLR